MSAACAGLWWLFDSTSRQDHERARAICDTCPMRAQCASIAENAPRGPGGTRCLEGTWAGKLYGARTRDRREWEDSLFTDDEARQAHNTFSRAAYADRNRLTLGDRVLMGERVYQRRIRARRRAVA